MSCCSRTPSLFLACFALVLLGATQAFTHGNEHHGGDAESAAGHSHTASQIHGGEVVMTQEHHFEVAFTPSAVRVFAYDGHQKPLSSKGVTGEATVSLRHGKPERVPLRFVAATDGGSDYLEGAYAFQSLKPGDAKIAVQLSGLTGSEAAASFKATFAGVSKAHAPAAPHTHGDGHEHHGDGHEDHDHGEEPHAH